MHTTSSLVGYRLRSRSSSCSCCDHGDATSPNINSGRGTYGRPSTRSLSRACVRGLRVGCPSDMGIFFFFFSGFELALETYLCVVVGILAFSSWINCSETHLIKIVCWWFKFDGKKPWAMTYCLISSLLQRIRQKSMLCIVNMGPDGKCRCP